MSDYPTDVTHDLNNGFFITDEDDGCQRCKIISDTVFIYKSGHADFAVDIDGQKIHVGENEQTIDVDKLSAEQIFESISPYYGNIDNLEDLLPNVNHRNQIIAECYFETN